jgi:large subunit ribosomal protein L24e
LEFEKRRNVPVKYDRDLVAATVSAVQRVGEIKARRERAFWSNRMTTQKPTNLAQDMREVERMSHLLGVKPDEVTSKALEAVEKRKKVAAAAAEAKKKTTKEKGKLVVELPEDGDEEEEQMGEGGMEEDESMELDAIAAANVVEKETTPREKIKVKSRVKKSKKSALVPAGGRRMGMELD